MVPFFRVMGCSAEWEGFSGGHRGDNKNSPRRNAIWQRHAWARKDSKTPMDVGVGLYRVILMICKVGGGGRTVVLTVYSQHALLSGTWDRAARRTHPRSGLSVKSVWRYKERCACAAFLTPLHQNLTSEVGRVKNCDRDPPPIR